MDRKKYTSPDRDLTKKEPIFKRFKRLRNEMRQTKKQYNDKMTIYTYLKEDEGVHDRQRKINWLEAEIDRLAEESSRIAEEYDRTVKKPATKVGAIILAGTLGLYAAYYNFVEVPKEEFHEAWSQSEGIPDSEDAKDVTDQALLKFKILIAEENGFTFDPSALTVHDKSRTITPTADDPRSGDLTLYYITMPRMDESGNIMRDPSGKPYEGKTLYSFESFAPKTAPYDPQVEEDNMPEEYKTAIQLISAAQGKNPSLPKAQKAFTFVSKLLLNSRANRTQEETGDER